MLSWLRRACVVLVGGLGVAATFGGITTNLGGYEVAVGAADESGSDSDAASSYPATIPFSDSASAATGPFGASADGTLAGTGAGFTGSYALHTPPGLAVNAYYEGSVTEFTVDTDALFDFAASLTAGTLITTLTDVTDGTAVFDSTDLAASFSGSLEAGRLYTLFVGAYVESASQDSSGSFTFSVASIPLPVSVLLGSAGLATALMLARRSWS